MTSLDATNPPTSVAHASDSLDAELVPPRTALDEVLVSRPTELFLQSRAVGSPRTVEWYRDSLRDFYRVTAQRPEDATEEDLIAYFAKMI